MILFRKEFVPLILAGKKTQTRRLWLSRRVKPGAIHWAQTSRFATSRFAQLRIISVERWDGKTISDADVLAEGFETAEEFWRVINELNEHKLQDPRRHFYKVEFEVV